MLINDITPRKARELIERMNLVANENRLQPAHTKFCRANRMLGMRFEYEYFERPQVKAAWQKLANIFGIHTRDTHSVTLYFHPDDINKPAGVGHAGM